ncbi:helix-turn-helix transcriptional regulator [Lysinibacillus irui]|uniref:Helix-turn-helix transcriptional regulator n=1 Tax=Lysinibacillus irui TaxID=2998077 RepID=A0ABU5NFS6_9BACI|nr:helix-turn-helix transcriptional regulator [Lysinibacillus irui]MEA0554169.1 helix-turn-helix transcriptional regulator [Lysinibacillus irui]MEA0974889.1 helix-turn-helix transcriptional regulator [Lysinibacillus irui]MEA1041043.1 helix-turn-helix transcriptional regulator [Lysinibacillus irui]
MISNELKNVRKKRGISIAELARRTNLSRMTISNIENQNAIPKIDTAFSLARELEVDITSIFFEGCVNHDLQKG